jgi:hypothetical protein
MPANPATGSTAYNINDPRTQKVWSKKFFKFMLENMVFSSLMGTDGNSPIAKVTDLTVKKGGSIVFEMEAPLTGNGIGDHGRFIAVDGTDTFNTEAMKDYNVTVAIHERGNSVQAASKITDQYTSTDVKTSGLRRLGVWMAEALEDDIVAAASGVGNVNQTGTAKTGIETVNAVEPTQNRYFAIGYNDTTEAVEYTTIDGTSSSGITGDADQPLTGFTTDAQGLDSRFNTDCISFLRRKAREVIVDSYGGVSLKIPKLTPLKIDGKETYCMVISRLQEKSLRADAKWITAQQEGNVRGESNPIFSGAIGIWDGVVIKVSERAQYRVGAGGVTATEYFNDYIGSGGATVDAIAAAASGTQVDRGLFLGANAVVVAYAQMPQKHMTMEDIGRIPTVAVDSLYGVKNVAFNYYNTTSWATSAGTNIATELYGTIIFDTIVDPD